jgi:hypothetical protein
VVKVKKGGLDMKSIRIFSVTVLALSVMLTACAGGGGGGGGAISGTTTTSSLTKTVALSPVGSIDVPFANSAVGRRSMMLYTAQEMKGSGTITAISFKYFASPALAVSCPNTTIKMGHTSQGGLNATFASNSNINNGQGSQQTVLTSSTVNIPVGTPFTYYTVPLTTPFNYNGVDNLVVEITHDACTGDVFTANHDGGGANVTNEAAGATTLTGGLRTWRPDTKFNLSGGENSIRYTDSGTTGYINALPFVVSSKIQLLYDATEINGSGIITGIAFPVGSNPRGNPTVAGSSIVTVKLGHTSLSALTGTGLTTTFVGNFNIGTPVTVASARTFTIPAGIPDGTYVWIPLTDGAFNYNGINNLVVEIETSATTGNAYWIRDTSGNNTRLDLLGVPPPLLSNDRYFIKFRFAGGTINIITNGGGGGTGLAFDMGAIGMGRLNLYRATELGSAGAITSVACRMQNAASMSTSYANYKVIIGHSNVNSLVATPASNFVSQNTVFNGTVAVPAGLVMGDWIEVPLSTPFAYDGMSNLAIWMGTTGASGAGTDHLCMISTLDAARYPGQIAQGMPGAGSVTVQDYKFDMKLKISR